MNKSIQTYLICVTLASLNGEVEVTNSHQCRPWIKLEITRFKISVNKILHVIFLFFPSFYKNTQQHIGQKECQPISSACLCTLGHYGAVFVYLVLFFLGWIEHEGSWRLPYRLCVP